MARMARVVVPGFPHHVTQRGNRKQRTFFNESDYRTYRSYLAKYCAEADTAVWAYCFMPNHVHLVMVPSGEDGLRSALGEAHRHYTQRVNLREGWRGHLWQERFHSFPMDERYLQSVVRYVELNPVAAGLCQHPKQWPWSSARAHLEGHDDELVKVKPMLDRVCDWRGYLSSAAEPDELAEIRRSSRTGRPLGNQIFTEALERLTERCLQPQRRGRKSSVQP